MSNSSPDNPFDASTEDDAAPVAPEDLTDVRLGDHVIRGLIGKGGMGTVYRAEDTSLGREVAIKIIRPELARGPALARFMREARAMASLSHPNLLAIHAIGRAKPVGDLPYFVMELIRGKSLAQILRQSGPPPATETLRIAQQILDALDAVHAAGITHRDLKPANIMIREDDGRPVLMDFGIAKVEQQDDESGLTTEGLVIGTPEYMAPEQAEGRDVDARTDLYAFGIMLYQMIAGRVPFRGKSAFRVLRQQVESEADPLDEIAPDCPETLVTACQKCMQKDPAERHQSARQLADELGTVRADDSPKTRPTAAVRPEMPPTAATVIDEKAEPAALPAPTAPPVQKPPAPVEETSSGHGGLIVGVAAAVVLALLVLWWNRPGPPPRWTKDEINAVPYTRLKLPDGATRKVRLMAIEPMPAGGHAITYWHKGRLRRIELEAGFEWDNRPPETDAKPAP